MPYLISTPEDPLFPYVLATPPPSPRSSTHSSSPSSSYLHTHAPTQDHAILLKDARDWGWDVEYKGTGDDAYSKKYWKERLKLEKILGRDRELRECWVRERRDRIMRAGVAGDDEEVRAVWRGVRERERGRKDRIEDDTDNEEKSELEEVAVEREGVEEEEVRRLGWRKRGRIWMIGKQKSERDEGARRGQDLGVRGDNPSTEK